MRQSTSHGIPVEGLHVGIIMDGNGRWATRQGLERIEGHRAGARAVHRSVEAALRLDIGMLTLFAFSEDNWARPPREVGALLGVFEGFLRAEAAWLAASGIRSSVIGRRDRLPPSLLEAIGEVEETTAFARAMDLRIAIDYSGREAIVQAAQFAGVEGAKTKDEFSRLLARGMHAPSPPPDVDLLIRTGGEQRLSDLPLWEIAYAELYFTERMWPDFDTGDLEMALDDFHRRERRFGRIPELAAS